VASQASAASGQGGESVAELVYAVPSRGAALLRPYKRESSDLDGDGFYFGVVG
jgi:hypothetical protein